MPHKNSPEDRERRREYARKYRINNGEALREKRLAKYRANPDVFKKRNQAERERHPERVKQYNLTYYFSNTERARERSNADNDKVRAETFSAYGGKCQCCGEERAEFLCIDHVKGGGSKHRMELGMSGVRFYRWLRRAGFPSGYRVLCHNCNMSLGLHGYCPHRPEETVRIDRKHKGLSQKNKFTPICLDCLRPISDRALRCSPCVGILQRQRGTKSRAAGRWAKSEDGGKALLAVDSMCAA